MNASVPGALIIACGALAQEIAALRRINNWDALDIQCLPPELHNRPEQIPARVREAIRAARDRYARIFVAYADCGTGGRLDAVLQEQRFRERQRVRLADSQERTQVLRASVTQLRIEHDLLIARNTMLEKLKAMRQVIKCHAAGDLQKQIHTRS